MEMFERQDRAFFLCYIGQAYHGFFQGIGIFYGISIECSTK